MCTYKTECCVNTSFIKKTHEYLHSVAAFPETPMPLHSAFLGGLQLHKGRWKHWCDLRWCLMTGGPQAILSPDLSLCSFLWAKGTPGCTGPWTLSCPFPALQHLYPCSLPASLSPSQGQQIPLFSFSVSAHSLCTSQLSFLSHTSLSSDSFRSINLLPHRVTSSMLFQPNLCVSAPPARWLLSRLRDGAEKWWIEVLGFAGTYSDQEHNMSSNGFCPAYPASQSQLKGYSRFS